MKLIHGDLFEQEFSNEFDLIIADIPYVELWDYDFVFFKLSSFLKEDAVLVVTIDTPSIPRAFIKYMLSCNNHLNLFKLDMFEDGNIWGNIMAFSLKNSCRNLERSEIIRLEEGTGKHPNSKNKRLYEIIITSFSKEGDKVLDPFMGEGNTAKVCKTLNRDYTGVEINKEYFDLASKAVGNS